MIEKIKNFWGKGIWSKLIVILVVFALFGIIGSAGSGSENSNNTEVTKTEQQKEKKKEVKKETKKEEIVSMNKSKKVGDFEYTIKSKTTAKTLGDPNMLGVKANGEFVVVELNIKNVSKKSQMFSEGSIKLICDDKEYEISSEATTYFMGEKSELWVGEINPDITKKGKIAFDVPEKIAKNKNVYLQISGSFLDKPVKFSLK